ncbi:hypothetical protein C0989_003468 [Termitomyces sp. Mn162]|nr:hypothetical protein C0989_003468 [Termitomyces sp. Mn162]
MAADSLQSPQLKGESFDFEFTTDTDHSATANDLVNGVFNWTGLCVYEIDDPALRDDPSLDENTRLKNRIAELESLVRELRGDVFGLQIINVTHVGQANHIRVGLIVASEMEIQTKNGTRELRSAGLSLNGGVLPLNEQMDVPSYLPSALSKQNRSTILRHIYIVSLPLLPRPCATITTSRGRHPRRRMKTTTRRILPVMAITILLLDRLRHIILHRTLVR